MKIEGVSHVINNSPELFYKQLTNAINELQNSGQEVEVQYRANAHENIRGLIVYTALVIGRK